MAQYSPSKLGGVVEWFMAPVLKTGRAQALVGSNPTPSAIAKVVANLRISFANFSNDTQEIRTRFNRWDALGARVHSEALEPEPRRSLG